MEQFRKEGEESIRRLFELRDELMSSLFLNEGDVNNAATISKSSLNTTSKILRNDKEGRSKGNYLWKQLGNPSKLKLLFRASQHSFSAPKFHELCDNIPKTVTIVRTEFDRTIAAYTPLKWQATEDATWVADPSLSSFLLQLELREKMALINGQESYAIQNHKNWGPVFGEYDLYIANKCSQNSNSFANFPFSYNCGGKYIRNQESRTSLSGATKGQFFRVVEYEVFEVIK